MKLDINENEKAVLLDALDKAQASAKRQQASSKQPQLQAVYRKMETDIVAMTLKLQDAK